MAKTVVVRIGLMTIGGTGKLTEKTIKGISDTLCRLGNEEKVFYRIDKAFSRDKMILERVKEHVVKVFITIRLICEIIPHSDTKEEVAKAEKLLRSEISDYCNSREFYFLKNWDCKGLYKKGLHKRALSLSLLGIDTYYPEKIDYLAKGREVDHFAIPEPKLSKRQAALLNQIMSML